MFTLGARAQCPTGILARHSCEHAFFPSTHTFYYGTKSKMVLGYLEYQCLSATLFCAQAPVLGQFGQQV